MKNIKIILADPRHNTVGAHSNVVPIGIGYIGSHLINQFKDNKENKLEVKLSTDPDEIFNLDTFKSFIRKFKLDELSQLWNVLIGDMSLVGPRPNVKKETDLYTLDEKDLLKVRPGITDFSSIVFSDEGKILV